MCLLNTLLIMEVFLSIYSLLIVSSDLDKFLYQSNILYLFSQSLPLNIVSVNSSILNVYDFGSQDLRYLAKYLSFLTTLRSFILDSSIKSSTLTLKLESYLSLVITDVNSFMFVRLASKLKIMAVKSC